MSGKGPQSGLQKARIGFEASSLTFVARRILKIPATAGSACMSVGGISAAC